MMLAHAAISDDANLYFVYRCSSPMESATLHNAAAAIPKNFCYYSIPITGRDTISGLEFRILDMQITYIGLKQMECMLIRLHQKDERDILHQSDQRKINGCGC